MSLTLELREQRPRFVGLLEVIVVAKQALDLLASLAVAGRLMQGTAQ